MWGCGAASLLHQQARSATAVYEYAGSARRVPAPPRGRKK
jgi:hypothetical protein